MRKILAAALALSLTPCAARAEIDYAAMIAAAATGPAAEYYARFADKAAMLHTSAADFCGAPTPDELTALRGSYHAAMDAWQSAQWIGFGPVEAFNRGQRIHFWPDKRNSGDRQILALLKDKNIEALSPARIAFASVAVQGFPLLETMLFEARHVEAMVKGGEDGAFRCALVGTIGANLAKMAADLKAEWSGSGGFADQVKAAGQPQSPYADSRMPASQFFNALHAHMAAIAEVKLAHPLGASPAEARPGRSESRRAERSLRNIAVNLNAVESVFAAAFQPQTGAESAAAFLDVLHRAQSIAATPDPMEQAMSSPQGWERLNQLKNLVKQAADIWQNRIGADLDIQVGFNALDGD